jgi:hypothetical protein
MLKIEYEITLNEQGRPCIDLSPDYEHNPDDKFFALEMSRYYLQTVFNKMGEKYDQHTKDTMDIGIRLLGQIGDEMAELIYGDMRMMGDVAVGLRSKYQIQVKSIEERDAIPLIGYFYKGKIFNRQEGLRVCIREMLVELYKDTVYELQGGISNDNWVEI